MTPLPPKQGLKRQQPPAVCPANGRYDTTSTKTRIETDNSARRQYRRAKVMTPLPPKQGLKLVPIILDLHFYTVMTPLPPKQGLKQTAKTT